MAIPFIRCFWCTCVLLLLQLSISTKASSLQQSLVTQSSMVENHHDCLDLLFSSYSHAMYLRHTNYASQSVSPQWPIYQENTSHLVVSTVQAQGIKLGEKKQFPCKTPKVPNHESLTLPACFVDTNCHHRLKDFKCPHNFGNGISHPSALFKLIIPITLPWTTKTVFILI